MPESQPQDLKKLHLRAKLPKLFRFGAVLVVAIVVVVIGIGFYRSNNDPRFRMSGLPTSLSKEVTAVITNYERRETEGDVLKYYIKADKATTFADNHQELENVYLEVYDATGEKHDTITAQHAIYIPEENKNFKGYFAGGVNVVTRDGLKVKTEQVTYTKATEIAEAEELVEFERDGVVGKSIGAIVRIADKKLELLKDVDIQSYESPELAKANVRQAHIQAGYASVDQASERIDLERDVKVNIVSTTTGKHRETDVDSSRAVVFFSGSEGGSIDAQNIQGGANRKLKKLELFENVKINTREAGGPPTVINSGYALYDKDADRFDLKNGVNIVTAQNDKSTTVNASEAVYEQGNGKIFLHGGADVAQGSDYLKGDNIIAELYPDKSLKTSVARGNAYLKQVAPDRTVEINAGELNAAFNETQKMLAANALGMSTAVLIPAQATDYSRVTMTAPNAIRVKFKGEGLLDGMQTEGRTTINLSVPDNAPDAANKKVTADTVKTIFGADGKDIQKAEAIGNAELYVEPLKASSENYKTTVNSPRFDCEFFPTGNNAKTCVAATKTKTVRVPTVPAESRGNQTLIADTLSAFFSQQSRDVERFEANGNTKFTELDRNAIANQILFNATNRVVNLRGGEPTVWDNQGRAKAKEIDWDTKNQKSLLRGGVSTTYYSQKGAGGATPFGSSDKPVFITAQDGEFDHANETGTYTGNARAWQENNYIRANRFFIQQKQGQFNADGNVQSLIYDAKRKEKNKETQVPVYAASNKMFYNRDSRQIRYDENVDIRQGTDRIVSGSATVYLDDKNDLSKTVAENSVVITQPNRRATGDYAQYTAADEMVILRGSPARVEDGENGSSESSQITVYMRDNRVIGENKPKGSGTPGRTRSVYKVKNANIIN